MPLDPKEARERRALRGATIGKKWRWSRKEMKTLTSASEFYLDFHSQGITVEEMARQYGLLPEIASSLIHFGRMAVHKGP